MAGMRVVAGCCCAALVLHWPEAGPPPRPAGAGRAPARGSLARISMNPLPALPVVAHALITVLKKTLFAQAVPTVPAGVSTPTVPPAGCCAHTRGEHARRFPSPRSCALTPTFLQVLATELPRPYPTPIPIARALLAAQLSLSRSTLSLNSLDSHARMHAAPRTPTSLTATAP